MKLFMVRTRWKNVAIILLAMFFLLRVLSTALIPSLFGMLVYRERISIVTRILFSGILSKLLIFRMKSIEYLTNDLSSFTCGCNMWSIYFDILIVWQSIELITALTGFPFLRIFRNILNCGAFASELVLAVFSSKKSNVFNSLILVLSLVQFNSILWFGNFL